jgi:signal transduction histidine kinase
VTESSKDATQLVAIFERTGATALVVAGSIEFLPSLFLLLLHRDEIPALIWLTWVVPVAIFLIAFLPSLRRQRAMTQAAAGLLFLLLAIVFAQAYGPGWLPLPFSAFAVAFGAAFTLGVVPALVVIALAALLNLIAVLAPTPQMILAAADLAGGAIGPIFILIAAPALLGMAYSWRRAARIADASTAEIETAAAVSYRAVQVQSARTSVDRRIHETVLNTLNAITQGVGSDGNLLRAECRRDIEQLELGALPAHDATLGALVDEARLAAALRTPQVRVDVDTDFLLPQQSAGALRDALVEALRNVERHAQATSVDIDARLVSGALEVVVRDDGRGLREGDTERFGMRNTIKASLSAIGGEAIVESAPGRGTSVTLRVPIVVAAELQVPVSPVIDILLDSVRTRAFLFAPTIFGLVMLPWIASGLGDARLAFALSFIAFLGCNIALAVRWNTSSRVPLTLLALVLGIMTYAITGHELVGCASASSVHWIINSVAGGIGLLLFAGQRYWWHWLFLPIITAAGLVLTLALPSECNAVPAMSLVVTVVYMSAALFLMTVLFREFDRRRADGLVLWASSVEYQAEIERQITITSQWSRVSASTIALLKGIADGSLDAGDALVRERAAGEESQLRGNLGFERLSSSYMWRAVLDVVEVAAEHGLSVDVAAISTPTSSRPIPEIVKDFLSRVVLGSPSRTVTIRLFVDDGQPEVIVTALTDVVALAWQAAAESMKVTLESTASTLTDSGIQLSRTAISERQTIVSIRRDPEAGQ